MSDSSNPSYPSYPGESAGFQQPQSVYGPAPALRPAHGLAIAAAILAGVLTLVEIVEAVFAWTAKDDYLDAANNGTPGYDVFTPYDLMAVPFYLAAIAAYVVTCVWLNQARTNTEILSPNARQARSKGWIWGGWLVPVVSLWFPYQVVRDVALAFRAPHKGKILLGWWWTFWLMTLIFSRIGGRLVSSDEIDTGAIRALGPVETINALVAIIGLVLWLRIIRWITDEQDDLIGDARG